MLLSGRARIMEHAVYEYIMYVLLPMLMLLKLSFLILKYYLLSFIYLYLLTLRYSCQLEFMTFLMREENATNYFI